MMWMARRSRIDRTRPPRVPVPFFVPNRVSNSQAEGLLDTSRWQVRLRRTPSPDCNDNEYDEPKGLDYFWGVNAMPSESNEPFRSRTPGPAFATTMPVPRFLAGRMLRIRDSHTKLAPRGLGKEDEMT